MTNLAMGGNAPIASPECVLDIQLPQGVEIDVSALQLYSGGKVRGDGDMCFFNQPSIGAGAISLTANDNKRSFTLNLAKVDNEVEKIVVNATLDSAQFSAVGNLTLTTSCGINMLVETSGRSEAALILCEIYKRNGQWKVRNVSQGFNGGLQALAEHFGMEIDEPSTPVAASAPASSAPNSASSPAPASTPSSGPAPTSAPTSTPSSTPAPTSSPAPTPSPAPVQSSNTGASLSSTAPSMFNRLKQSAEQARSKLSTEASKFKNRSFMEAVVNGCVLVAAADGSIDATEKQKMAGFIQLSDELKHFDMGEVIKVFQNAAADFESDNVIGKVCALEKIRKIKTNEDQARLLVRVVQAIGAADGEFDTQEREMVTEIARELGLNPADFDI